MWSRRWRQNQEKMVDRSAYMETLKTMPFPAMMQDRIRWAQYAEAMASAHNLYAVSRWTDPRTRYYLKNFDSNQINNDWWTIWLTVDYQLNAQTPMPPPYFYQTPATLQPSPAPSLVHPTLSPPPVPPRNKVPVRQAASLPVALVTSTANQMINNLQELARKISRKKKKVASPTVSRHHRIDPSWRFWRYLPTSWRLCFCLKTKFSSIDCFSGTLLILSIVLFHYDLLNSNPIRWMWIHI